MWANRESSAHAVIFSCSLPRYIRDETLDGKVTAALVTLAHCPAPPRCPAPPKSDTSHETDEERNQERTVPDQIDFPLKLTRGCDAVESHKGVKAGGGSGQDARPSEGHESARSDTLPARQQLRQATRAENTV